MPMTFGKEPVQNLRGEITGLPAYDKSGLVKLLIMDANFDFSAADGFVKDEIDPFMAPEKAKNQRISLRCAAMGAQGCEGLLSVSAFFNDREQMSALLYFLDMRNANGDLELPDPVLHQGISKTGRAYRFWSYETLRDRSVYALVEFHGKSLGSNGAEYSNFKLIGFTDARGFDAVSVCSGSPVPAKKYADFLARFPASAAPVAPAATAPRPAAYGSQPVPANPYGSVPSPAGILQAAQQWAAQPLNPAATAMYGGPAVPQPKAPADTDIPF